MAFSFSTRCVNTPVSFCVFYVLYYSMRFSNITKSKQGPEQLVILKCQKCECFSEEGETLEGERDMCSRLAFCMRGGQH